MYGIQGVLLVETLHLFPLMTLSIVDALGKISPSLDEAAESVGSRGLRKFWDITFPLTTPGYVSGALLVFIWTFADFATPLVVGVSDLLASQAYLNIVQFVDRRLFKMGIVISAIMVILAILFLIIAKQYVAIKDYSSLAYSKIERKKMSPLASGRSGRFPDGGSDLCLHPLSWDRSRLLRQRMGLDTLPGQIHTPVFRAGCDRDPEIHPQQPPVFRHLRGYLHRLRSPCGLDHGKDQGAGEGSSRLPDHIDSGAPGDGNRHCLPPGLQRSHALHEHGPDRGLDCDSDRARGERLPYTVRGTFASLQIVHRSFEEAAESVGATKMTTFKDVTLPLIWKGVLVGSLYSFILALQEASATLLLVVPGHEMMTVGIFNFYLGGSVNEAAALGFILIILGALCLFVINRVTGTKMGGVFG